MFLTSILGDSFLVALGIKVISREENDVKRRKVSICDAAKVAGYDEWWQVPIENMGFCRDGVTRWYFFEAEDGTPCVTFKY